MPDKVAERNRRRRDRVLEQYRIGYCMPYCRAAVNGEPEADRLLTRCYDFKLGVAMADGRNGRWTEKFNEVYHDCMRMLGEE